jgi:hypothetical protein
MTTLRTSCAAVLLAGVGSAASSSDLRFGADGLPYLARNATLVVEVASAERLRATPAAQLFQVRPGRVLKGSAAGPLLVVVALARDVPPPEVVPEATLFLRPRRADAFGDLVPGGRPSFEVVSGGVGVVKPDSSGRRKDTIREYVALAESGGKLEWAKRNLAAEDAYVQRSAMLELAEPTRSPSDPGVVQVLSECLRASGTKWENKGMAVNLLARSASPEATSVLDGVARDAAAPQALRLDAVQAVAGLPGGRERLREYRADPVLAPKAEKILRDQPVTGDATPPTPRRTLADVQRLMASRTLSERREGASAAGELVFSEDVVRLLRQAAGPRETSPAVQLAALDSLARFNRRESALALSEVARDAQLPPSVRASAVLSLAKIESGVAQPVLRQLADTLQDAELRKLAKGLAEQ